MRDENQLRKEIDEGLQSLDKNLKDNYNYPAYMIKDAVVVLAKIAALADIASARTEKMNLRLVGLTWALFFLTLALLAVTVISR